MHAISKIIINSIENNKKIIIPKYLKDKLTISEGYYIQNEVNNFFLINNIFKGWKIGCTTPVMQKYLGIPNPCLGKVMAKNLFEGFAFFESNRRCNFSEGFAIACSATPTASACARRPRSSAPRHGWTTI